ncbi:MAG: hypothetical protein KKA05_00810, partial [Alphaproteobacteria bacterium]|nr:hypothetical protein [Alphaproteobacteria bacterium]
MFQDERTPYCVIFNRESFLAARVTGTVYQFPGDGFKQVIVGSYATHEYISSQTVRLHRADRIPVNGIDDLMADGVQVLFTRPGLSENEFFLKLRQAHYNPETLLQQENLISENVVRGLKPALI